MPIVDGRGRRKANTDSRVSEETKANLPAYGFDGLTIGEIMQLRSEKKDRDAAEGKRKMTTDDKKY